MQSSDGLVESLLFSPSGHFGSVSSEGELDSEEDELSMGSKVEPSQRATRMANRTKEKKAMFLFMPPIFR